MLTFTIEKPKEISFGIQNVDLGADAYDRGYEEGEKEGYTNGYEAGAKEGAEVGYAKGEQEGYSKGVAEVEAQNAEILTDCNTQLESKGVEGAETLEQVPQRIEEIVVQDDLAKYATDVKFRNPNMIPHKHLVLNFPTYAYLHELCAFNVQETSDCILEHITLNASKKITYARYAFSFGFKCQKVKRITLNADFSQCTNFTYFINGTYATIVDGMPIDCSSSTTEIYCAYNESLEEIRFVPLSVPKNITFKQSKNLSDASIQSIIDGLADLTGATTQTLSLHKDVGNKLTQSQKDAISAKNWTLVY